MQMRRDGESILSPSSMIINSGEGGISGGGSGNGGGEIGEGDGRVHFQGSSVVSNMLHEIIADEVMHTPVTGRHRIGLSKQLVTALNDIEEEDDDFPDPLSDNELFEILLEIEASVWREKHEEGPEEPVSRTNNGMMFDSDMDKEEEEEEEEEWDRQGEEVSKRNEEEEEYYARLASELASDKDDR
jgi:hypothetical protein